ncbi:MAG: hypothetical protein NTV06_02085 [candidate division Zixibacteria bacterium]|nr:hypothetical protein [candidate division Zixibacteria bacterium]
MGLFGGAVELPEDKKNPPIPDEENAILEKLALKVVRWRMAVPAILFLESVKPLNYIGSQALVFFEPMVQTVFNFKDYETLRMAMERRENVENLLQKIEKYDALMYERERAIRKFMKAERKKWKWYQRYLGIARPKIILPENLCTPTFDAIEKK